jgi:coenzyme F420 hydrogenase subunit beta
VDRVIHVAPDPEQPTRNTVTCSTTVAEIADGAGSRYSSSSPLSAIDRTLADGGSFAFVGKPCDVSALRRLASVDERVERHARLILSFFCAGIPSHAGAERVLAAMGTSPDQVVAFRYRGEGWPGNAAATLADGSVRTLTYAESWGDHLSREVQFRCKVCPDAVGGVADIACADAWYGDERGYPIFEEHNGRSLVVARTRVGEDLLASAMAAGAIVAQPLAIEEVEKMQPGQGRRKRHVAARLAALSVTLQPRVRIRGTLAGAAARRATPAAQLRDFIGTIRRVLNGRRSRL